MPGAEAAEFLHHSSLAALKISDFVGREELVQKALEIIQEAMRLDTTVSAVAPVAASPTIFAITKIASAASAARDFR